MKKTTPNRPGSQSAPERPLAPADLRAISEEIERESPLDGEQAGVVLMDIDPRRLHAYWNLRTAELERARAEFAAGGQQAHLVLRFQALADGETEGSLPLEVFDRELQGASGQLEVQVRGDGGRYEAKLGLTAADGGWKPLARSNRVQMPPAGPTRQVGMATLNLADAPLSAEEAVTDAEPPVAADSVPELPISEDPSLRGGPADELEPRFPNPAPLEKRQEPGPTAQPVEIRQLHPDIPQAPERHFEPAGLSDLAAASRHLSSADHSSSAFGNVPGELELHAELHIYGRARPGRELFLFGRPVSLAADGSFDLWRELDPGSLLLPILMSGDGKPQENS